MEPIPELRKIRTGIPGLDKMLHGGLIEGRPYLVTGGPGAGKSIFVMQYLMQSIRKGEDSLYITLEEPFDEIRQNMANFGWDTRAVRILDVSPEAGAKEGQDMYSLSYLEEELRQELQRRNHKRVGLDSTSTLRLLEEHPLGGRRRILTIMKLLTEMNCTSMIICETSTLEPSMESFLARGVIRLYTTTTAGEKIRAIGIEKMRGTSFDEHIRPFTISEKGITIAADEIAFETFH
jgi:circadian clock protein KaiC